MNGILANGTTFGYCGFSDWIDSVLLSFPGPWSIAPDDHTYYGTGILDASGQTILRIWMSWGKPSERAQMGMSDEEWREYCCDSHWESEIALRLAESIVGARNVLHEDGARFPDESVLNTLRSLIQLFCEWDGAVWELIRCGGPLRRALPSDPEIASHFPNYLKNKSAALTATTEQSSPVVDQTKENE